MSLKKELMSEERTINTRMYNMNNWVQASFMNYAIVEELFKEYTCCVRGFFEKHKGEAAICVASGASLDHDIPALQKWKGVLICGASQVHTLHAHGIIPDYVLLYDSNWEKMSHAYPDLFDYEAPLITNPQMDPIFTREWIKKNRAYYYLAKSFAPQIKPEDRHISAREFWKKYVKYPKRPVSNYMADEFDIFTRLTLSRAYEINAHLGGNIMIKFPNTGCTNNMEICWADFLGCKPIGMAGYDGGTYVGDYTRFEQIRYDREKDKPYYVKRGKCELNDKAEGGEKWGFYKQNRVVKWRDDFMTTTEFMGYNVGLYKLSCSHDLQLFELVPEDEGYGLEMFPVININQFVTDPYQFSDQYLDHTDRWARANDQMLKKKLGPLAKPAWHDNPELMTKQKDQLREVSKIP